MRTAAPLLPAVATLCAVSLAAAAPDPPLSPTPAPAPAPADKPPADPALDLIQAKCTSCHDADFIFQARRPVQAWGDIVNEMVGRGADLNDAETAQVRAYLEKNWSLPPAP